MKLYFKAHLHIRYIFIAHLGKQIYGLISEKKTCVKSYCSFCTNCSILAIGEFMLFRKKI